MTAKPTVFEALAAVMGDVRAVGKGDRNSQQGYQFRGIDAVVNAVGPVLRKHGVVVVPQLEEVHYRDVQTSTGKASRECTVKVRYRFYGPAGDHIDCVTPGESMDFGDKGGPKAMSVAFRIALLQALCLPTDDPDPDGQNYERGERPAEPPPADRPASGADAARERIKSTAAENGWDLNRIAAVFAKTHDGAALREVTDVRVITKFREQLFNLPQAELMLVNGAST